MSLRRIELLIDETDYDAIQDAIARRQRWQALPDSEHDDANISGRVIAEICRGWMEMHDSAPGEDDYDD